MSEPTEQDRETAAKVMRGQVDYYEIQDAAIAAALAAERAKARAPFLALADELEVTASRYGHVAAGSHDAGARNAHRITADRIRRAAEGTP